MAWGNVWLFMLAFEWNDLWHLFPSIHRPRRLDGSTLDGSTLDGSALDGSFGPFFVAYLYCIFGYRVQSPHRRRKKSSARRFQSLGGVFGWRPTFIVLYSIICGAGTHEDGVSLSGSPPLNTRGDLSMNCRCRSSLWV